MTPNPSTATSPIVKHWFSVFFLDKRYSWCGIATYSLTQINDLFAAVVWHPADHPALPGVVAQCRTPNLRGWLVPPCRRRGRAGERQSCAPPSGQHRSAIVGLQEWCPQISGPQRAPSLFMTTMAKAMTDEDIRVASDVPFPSNPQYPSARHTADKSLIGSTRTWADRSNASRTGAITKPLPASKSTIAS